MTAIIARDRDLQAFVQRAGDSKVLALDTEFMRERTYYPELCLIQAATAQEIVLIDPLAELDLSLLQPLLADGALKLLHACRQDLEVMATRFDAPLAPLFDTQLAAALCGYQPQWSYAKLVAEFSGIDLPKGATRTDWSQRPLSQVQLDYAADDVRYLAAAWEALCEKLEQLGRRQWFDEDMAKLAAEPWDVDPDTAWRRVKGHGQCQGAALAALQHLAAWREELAIRSNKPRRWIAKDESMLALAQARPVDAAGIEGLSQVEPFLKKRRVGELLTVLAEARTAEPPAFDMRIPDKAVIKKLRQALQDRAAALQVDPGVLATRADLNRLALDGHCPRVESGWRAEVIGAPLLAALG